MQSLSKVMLLSLVFRSFHRSGLRCNQFISYSATCINHSQVYMHHRTKVVGYSHTTNLMDYYNHRLFSSDTTATTTTTNINYQIVALQKAHIPQICSLVNSAFNDLYSRLLSLPRNKLNLTFMTPQKVNDIINGGVYLGWCDKEDSNYIHAVFYGIPRMVFINGTEMKSLLLGRGAKRPESNLRGAVYNTMPIYFQYAKKFDCQSLVTYVYDKKGYDGLIKLGFIHGHDLELKDKLDVDLTPEMIAIMKKHNMKYSQFYYILP